jgi:hypothetical protein
MEWQDPRKRLELKCSSGKQRDRETCLPVVPPVGWQARVGEAGVASGGNGADHCNKRSTDKFAYCGSILRESIVRVLFPVFGRGTCAPAHHLQETAH